MGNATFGSVLASKSGGYTGSLCTKEKPLCPCFLTIGPLQSVGGRIPMGDARQACVTFPWFRLGFQCKIQTTTCETQPGCNIAPTSRKSKLTGIHTLKHKRIETGYSVFGPTNQHGTVRNRSEPFGTVRRSSWFGGGSSWLWLKIKELGRRRFLFLVLFIKGAVLVHLFEPQPLGLDHVA